MHVRTLSTGIPAIALLGSSSASLFTCRRREGEKEVESREKERKKWSQERRRERGGVKRDKMSER